jgi:hypothetical protein
MAVIIMQPGIGTYIDNTEKLYLAAESVRHDLVTGAADADLTLRRIEGVAKVAAMSMLIECYHVAGENITVRPEAVDYLTGFDGEQSIIVPAREIDNFAAAFVLLANLDRDATATQGA